MNYLVAYNSGTFGPTRGFVNNWTRTAWEGGSSIATNLSASAPGRMGQEAIEVTFGDANGWHAIGLAHRIDWNNIYPLFLNQFKTLEFDIQFAQDSTGEENLKFIFEDAGHSTQPSLVSFIPGWSSMSAAEKRGTWHHVSIDLAGIQPDITRFVQFLFWNASMSRPHFFLADVKLGWVNDTTAPIISFGSAILNPTYTQLTLSFTTDEPSLCRVDYGSSTSYGHTLQAGTTDGDYASSFEIPLTGLTPGTTCYYRITATDHQFDSRAIANQSTYDGSYVVPPEPDTPPEISNIAIGNVSRSQAVLTWTTDRPCSAVLTYQRTGGSLMTRSLSDFVQNRSFVLDLLEPSTTYTVRLSATDAFGNLAAESSIDVITSSSGTPDVIVMLDPTKTRLISPYIYGRNSSRDSSGDPPHLTLNRIGGNRWTAYNWENNASNSGTDWGPYSNDDYLGGGDSPAEAVRSVIERDRSSGMATLMTIQLQGYVAADKDGLVDTSQSGYLSNRFKQVVYKKAPAAFVDTPSTTDSNVYMDEFLWALKNKFTTDIFGADAATPTFVSLDNEPDLWQSTHDEIQPYLIDPEAYIQKTIQLTQALKAQVPGAKMFGPVHYGFDGIANWSSSAGFSDTYWFTDKYLEEMRRASNAFGQRLLDVYDFHWYSEAKDSKGTRITDLTGPILTDDQVQAIVQSPRSLWDDTYTETSWIANWLQGSVNILGRIQAKIESIWPGTGVAITEYSNGGDQHIAGTLAQADNLGIFGDLGVFAACYWPLTNTYPFVMAGFRMFRGFDGASAHFGDTSIQATSSQIQNVSVHASLDSTTSGRSVFVAINRSSTYQEVLLSGQPLAGSAYVYRITQESAQTQLQAGSAIQPVAVGKLPISGSELYITLPPLSVSTIEIR